RRPTMAYTSRAGVVGARCRPVQRRYRSRAAPESGRASTALRNACHGFQDGPANAGAGSASSVTASSSVTTSRSLCKQTRENAVEPRMGPLRQGPGWGGAVTGAAGLCGALRRRNGHGSPVVRGGIGRFGRPGGFRDVLRGLRGVVAGDVGLEVLDGRGA